MKFKAHPLLPELIVNEDGTQVFFKGLPVYVKEYEKEGRHYKQKLLNFNSQSHTVIKIVCETWNGLRDHPSQVVKHKDNNPNNDHYTNLYWSSVGGYRTKKTKRAVSSKISEKEIEVILERLKKGDSLNAISKDYHTSDMSIHRIKAKYLKNAAVL